MNLFFLHGFLGRPSDWAPVKSHLPPGEGWRIFTPDYLKENSLTPQFKFEQWAKNFNHWVETQGCRGQKNILIGYSLGGRLALHALEQSGELWSQLLLVSANPGFDDEFDSVDSRSFERTQRWMTDSFWAEEFRKGSWDSVVKNWNSLPVFSGGSEEPRRIEKDYTRENLVLSLTQWSLAQQRNLRSVLKANPKKVTVVVGMLDEKYLQLSEKLKSEIPALQVELVPEASHRILFDQPKRLAEKIRQLLDQTL